MNNTELLILLANTTMQAINALFSGVPLEIAESYLATLDHEVDRRDWPAISEIGWCLPDLPLTDDPLYPARRA